MKPQHRASQGGLSAAGFTHYSQRLAFIDVQRNAVHRVQLGGLADIEIFCQFLQFDQGLAHTCPSSPLYRKHLIRSPFTSYCSG